MVMTTEDATNAAAVFVSLFNLTEPPFNNDPTMGIPQVSIWAARIEGALRQIEGAVDVHTGQIRKLQNDQAVATDVLRTEAAVIVKSLQADADKKIDDMKSQSAKYLESMTQDLKARFFNDETKINDSFGIRDQQLQESFEKVQSFAASTTTDIKAIVTSASTKFEAIDLDLKAIALATQTELFEIKKFLSSNSGSSTASPATAPPPTGTLPDPIQFTAWAGGGVPQTSQSAPFSPPGMGFPGSQRPLSIMGRNWIGNSRLDLIAKPEAFLIWKDRAISHLSKDGYDTKELLL